MKKKIKNAFKDAFTSTDLSSFRPLSPELRRRTKDVMDATRNFLDREMSYPIERRNEDYIKYLTAHCKMLERELTLNFCKSLDDAMCNLGF